MLGRRLRTLRKERGMTLTQVASEVGLSPSAISQIERGRVEPSLRTLRALSDVLEVPVFSVFVQNSSKNLVVRKDERLQFSLPDCAATYELLTPASRRRLEMVLTRLEPGTSTASEPLAHSGEECMHIMSGTAEVELGQQRFVLDEGDSIYIDEGVPHRVTNVGKGPLVGLWGMAPAQL